MKSQIMLEDTKKDAVISTHTAQSVLGKPPSYTNLFIHRLRKRGAIHELERGKYTAHTDAFLVASRITWPSYISLWSALRYHNLTEQVPHAIWVITTKQRRKTKLDFLGTEIDFIITRPQYFFGYGKVMYSGHGGRETASSGGRDTSAPAYEIFVAEPEKAVIDCLLFRRVSAAEIFEIIKNNPKKINRRKMFDYALRTENSALIKRTGHMLDLLGVDVYSKAKPYIYYPQTRLEQDMPQSGALNKKWRIIENVKLDA